MDGVFDKLFTFLPDAYEGENKHNIKAEFNLQDHKDENETGNLKQETLNTGCKKCEAEEVHECKLSNKEFKCVNCNSFFSSKANLRLHVRRSHEGERTYACDKCEKQTFTKQEMESHQKRTHKNIECKILRINCKNCQINVKHECLQTEKDLQCNECDYSTKWAQQLYNHHDSKHLGLLRYNCSICEVKAFHKITIERHINQQHQKQNEAKILKIGCEECQKNTEHKCFVLIRNKEKNFSTFHESRLNKHQSRHLKYSCNKCSYSSDIKQHISIHQKGKLHLNEKDLKVKFRDCDQCQQNIEHDHTRENSNPKFQKRNRISKGTQFKCTISGCEFTTNLHKYLETHSESFHLKIVKFKCNLCIYQSYSMSSLRWHQKIQHKGDMSFKAIKIGCKQCEENVTGHDHKRGSHLNKQEQKPLLDGKIYNCSECDFKTDIKANISSHHKKEHLNIMKFQCGSCDFRTFFLKEIQIHTRNHGNETKILYLNCRKCDIYEQHTEHEYVTSEVNRRRRRKSEKIICKECDHEPFHNFKERTYHFKLQHKDKKVYNCDYCKYGSNFRPNLQMHINSIHLNKKLNCPKCEYNTTWKTSFLEHMREQHKIYQKVSKHFPSGQTVLCEDCGESKDIKDKTHQCHGENSLRRRTVNRMRKNVQNIPIIGKYKCNKCDFRTDKPANVKSHFELIHAKSSSKLDSTISSATLSQGFMFQCRKCDFQSSVAMDLKSHIANH